MSSSADVQKLLEQFEVRDQHQLANFTDFVQNHRDIKGDLTKLKIAELTKVGFLNPVSKRVPGI